jgi:hypothetical protein
MTITEIGSSLQQQNKTSSDNAFKVYASCVQQHVSTFSKVLLIPYQY